MADQSNTQPGASNGQPQAGAGMQVRVVGQYIKDLSFESPNITKLLSGNPDNPNLKLEINVNANQVGPDLYEFGDRLQGRRDGQGRSDL